MANEYQTKCRKCGNQFLWISGINDGASIKPNEKSKIYLSFIKSMLTIPPLKHCRVCDIKTVQDVIQYGIADE